MLRCRVATADGRRVEHSTPIGLVQKFPKDEDVWREIDRLGILRHSRIQTTLDLNTQEDSDEARGAQGEFLEGVGVHSGMTQ